MRGGIAEQQVKIVPIRYIIEKYNITLKGKYFVLELIRIKDVFYTVFYEVMDRWSLEALT